MGRALALALLVVTILTPEALPAAKDGHGLDARLTGLDYPWPVRTMPLTAQGYSLELAYMDVGPSKVGKQKGTALLMHGKNFSGAYWEPTIELLSAAGYRVIAPDQIGFGKSSKPEGFQFTFQELARHDRELIDMLKIQQVIVIGHSMGGMLATRFALMYPGRVEAMVLVNPIGLEDYKRKVGPKSVDELTAAELARTPEKLREYMTETYFGGAWKPAYESLLTIPAGWMSGPDRGKIAAIAARTTDMILTQPVLYELDDVKAPVLLIIGSRDRTAIGKDWAPPAVKDQLGDYPTLARAASNAFRSARLVEIEDAGHLPQVTHFARYRAALLEFLADLPPL